MIVRDPEKRATLDEVMSDIWYRQYEDDDENIEPLRSISEDDHKSILHQMINGNIAEQEAIIKALNENQYNHITATYHLLAEKILFDNQDQNLKRQRRLLQPASDPFTEQIGVFIPPSTK
jgi:SNF-related kinase